MSEALPWNDPTFVSDVERRSGAAVSACFQCHKCSTGCPVAPEMDVMSSQIMRLIHLGARGEALASQAIWLCASCEACTTRCPQGIDIAAVMDTLRMMAVEAGVAARGNTFNTSFLSSVRRHGRVFEMGLMTAYKLRSGDLLGDVEKVPGMLKRGKLALWPKGSGNAKEVREVFKRAQQEEQNR